MQVLGIFDSFISILLLAFVVVAVGVLVVVLRRVFSARQLDRPGDGRRQPRLALVDVFDLDRQRQLVLVRRDNVEHLIMIGGPNDVVIETAIGRAPVSQAAAPREPAAAGGPLSHVPPTRVMMPVPPAPAPVRAPPAGPAAAPPTHGPGQAAAPPRSAPPARPPVFPPRPPSPPLRSSPQHPLGTPRPEAASPTRATPGASPPQPATPEKPPAGSVPPPAGAPPTTPTPAPAPANPLDALEEEMARLLGRPGPPKT